MGTVVDPFTCRRDPFAGGDGCGVADHGHQIPMSPRLGPKDAEAVLGIVEGDALDEARCVGVFGRAARCRASELHCAHLLLDSLHSPKPNHLGELAVGYYASGFASPRPQSSKK
jgi:hypothetical protein